LPSGLTLIGDTISGTPDTAGTSNFTIRATDGGGCTGDAALGIVVGECPTLAILPAALPNGMDGIAYSQSLTGSGGVGPYTVSLASGTLPGGLTLTANAIAGIPSGTGTANITLRVTDASGCSTDLPFALTIDLCPTITVGPASLSAGFVGVAYSQVLSATGGMGPYTYAIQTGALPAGLTLTGDTIGGLPTTAGTDNFTLRATDSLGCAGDTALSITVSACPAISINPTTLSDGAVGTPYSQTLVASGGNGAYSWSISAGTLPGGLNLVPGTGELTGTPTAGGAFTFTARAADVDGCAGTQEYTLTITGGCSLLGDLNGDSAVNGRDIQSFVDCLVTGSSPGGNCACGDFDASTTVGLPDVAPFIAALLGP